eukprot:TRINITY_DN7593_c0_g2_i10.p1 TRINITY_DN7593_c0_g2~~TRINITY_DN7593_c0_g2_i10.p1  ORF type:complete len:610 (+),score=156.64 TRINITY_DN7593_c0_g2_i10:92-1921(+)
MGHQGVPKSREEQQMTTLGVEGSPAKHSEESPPKSLFNIEVPVNENLPDPSTYKVHTFYPTYREFKNLDSYIKSLEAQGVHKHGICKIVPPKEWIPRKKGYVLEDIDFKIDRPLRQTLKPEPGQGGVFRFASSAMNPISVEDYARLAQTQQYVTPPHHTYEELEVKYWKSTEAANFLDPIYGADVNESLTDDECNVWNVSKLDSILKEGVEGEADIIPGINNSYLYFGMWGATFSWHVEDMDLYATNYLHHGAPKTWYCIPPEHAYRMELLAKKLFPDWHKICANFVRHKICMIHPDILRRHGIPVLKVVQEERNFIVVFPHAYHSGFNHGFNIAEAANFAMERWIDYGKRYRACCCAHNISAVDGQRLSLHPFISKYQPEKYDIWRKGRDFGPHPEDPQFIKDIFDTLDTKKMDKETETAVRKLAIVLDHPSLQIPEPVEGFDPVIKEVRAEDMDWSQSYVGYEFPTHRFDVKIPKVKIQKDELETLKQKRKEEEQVEIETEETELPRKRGQKRKSDKVALTRKHGFKGVTIANIEERKGLMKCKKKHKLQACRKCEGCQKKNCGTCIFCLDKPQFGGKQILKQKCVERVCNNPTVTQCPDCKWEVPK